MNDFISPALTFQTWFPTQEAKKDPQKLPEIPNVETETTDVQNGVNYEPPVSLWHWLVIIVLTNSVGVTSGERDFQPSVCKIT